MGGVTLARVLDDDVAAALDKGNALHNEWPTILNRVRLQGLQHMVTRLVLGRVKVRRRVLERRRRGEGGVQTKPQSTKAAGDW